MYTFKSVVAMMALSAVGFGIPLQQRDADALPQLAPPPVGYGPYGLKSLTSSTSAVPEPTPIDELVSVPDEPTAAAAVETTSSAPLATSVAAPLETTAVASVQPTSVAAATTLSTATIATASGSPASSAAVPSSTTAASNNVTVGQLVNNLLNTLLGGHR